MLLRVLELIIVISVLRQLPVCMWLNHNHTKMGYSSTSQDFDSNNLCGREIHEEAEIDLIAIRKIMF